MTWKELCEQPSYAEVDARIEKLQAWIRRGRFAWRMALEITMAAEAAMGKLWCVRCGDQIESLDHNALCEVCDEWEDEP